MARKLRADAQENRDRILVAARELFAERGVEVGMRDVARRAGVGPATLYRRFPTRQALLDEVVAGELVACRVIVEEGLVNPDPWQGLRFVVTELILRNATDQAFVDAIVSTQKGSAGLTEHRRKLLRMLHALAQRAKDQGMLREDFTTDGLVLVLVAARAAASIRPERHEAAAHRFAVLVLDALGRRHGRHEGESATTPSGSAR